MKYKIEDMKKNVVVITPTIGKDCLYDAVKSVYEQETNHNLTHLIVKDGPNIQIDDNQEIFNKAKITEVPFNTGANGYYGHRIYAGFSKMLDFDYVLLLDEDNWYEPNHVENLVSFMEQNKDIQVTFSLRKIFSKEGEFICNDDCESLGTIPVWCGDHGDFHVDTSSYCFTGKLFRGFGILWDKGWGADREFLRMMYEHNIPMARLSEYTLCYRLDGNKGSVTKEFFLEGNRVMKEKGYV